MKKLHTVYDFQDHAIIPDVGLTLLAFVAFGVLLFFYNKYYSTPRFISSKGKYFGLIMAAFAALIFLCISATRIRDYYEAKSLVHNDHYKIVEGIVQDYHPMPSSGHDTERFRVDSIYFEYSDYDLGRFGYNNAASQGGVMRENLYVQILYANVAGRIAILRIKTE